MKTYEITTKKNIYHRTLRVGSEDMIFTEDQYHSLEAYFNSNDEVLTKLEHLEDVVMKRTKMLYTEMLGVSRDSKSPSNTHTKK